MQRSEKQDIYAWITNQIVAGIGIKERMGAMARVYTRPEAVATEENRIKN